MLGGQLGRMRGMDWQQQEMQDMQPHNIEHIPTWAVAAATTIFTGLTGAIVFMFKLGEAKGKAELERIQNEHTIAIDELKSHRDELDVAVKECAKDREDLRVELAGVKVRLEMLEGMNKGS